MNTGENEGPAWNKFWLSMDNESESVVSGEGSRHPVRSLVSPDIVRPSVERGDSVLPNESASHNGGDEVRSDILEAPAAVAQDLPFPFKFKAPSGRVHRLQVVASAGMAELIANVTAKLGGELEAVGGESTVGEDGKLSTSGYALSYLDNEGDTVSLTTDQDLLDAIALAQHGNRDKVDLFVHDPEKPPMAATVEPQPGLSKPPTPPESTLRSRKHTVIEEEEEEEEEEQPVRHTRERRPAAPQAQEQLIAGVPNDLLLPGAIVTLAVVIVGVFAIGRASSR